jgi:hypothetical protein
MANPLHIRQNVSNIYLYERLKPFNGQLLFQVIKKILQISRDMPFVKVTKETGLFGLKL